jgi:CheY-like chemotaxis protein
MAWKQFLVRAFVLAQRDISVTRLRILFVDDNRISGLINCSLLRDMGYDVTEVFSGYEAIAEIRGTAPFSGLVTDVNLGAGPDGFEVARAARLLNARLPVIYVSAAEQARFAVEGVSNSVFIGKPYDPRCVVEALASFFAPGLRKPFEPGLRRHLAA